MLNALVVDFDVAILGSVIVVLVDTHEDDPIEIGCVSRDRSVGFAPIDVLDRGTHFEVADLASVAIGLAYHLEVAVVGPETWGRLQATCFALGMIDTGLDGFGEPAAFFLGDRGRNVGDEPSGAVASNLVDPAVSDYHSGSSILTVLEDPLIDAAEPSEAGDLPYDDALAVFCL
nr:hypothetical protein [Halococcus agarilyticus]